MINPDEMLFVVDEENNPLPGKSRKETHALQLWHRCSHIWIINAQKQILCQKRTMLKDNNPGKWEAHFGGHVRNGETYLDNAILETKEEIGLDRTNEEMHFFKIYKYETDKEFQGIFYTFWDGDFSVLKPEKDEVEEIKWIGIADLQHIFDLENPTWLHPGYAEELILQILQTESTRDVKDA